MTNSPELTVVKTGSAAEGTALGDTVTYTITVANTGNVTVDSITLIDTLTDAKGGALSLTTGPTFTGTSKAGAAGPNNGSAGTLVPGETATYTATYVIEQAVIDAGGLSNTATATGQDPSGKAVSDISDSGDEATDDDGDDDPTKDPTTITFERLPAQTISKRIAANADEDQSGDISVGDTLSYSIIATNSGNVSLSKVVVTDPMLDPGTFTCELVLPSATCELVGTYQVAQADVDAGSISNTAQVKSQELNEETKTTLETPLSQNPGLSIAKQVAVLKAGDYAVGEVVPFEITVTNSGNQTLTNVVVVDDKLVPAKKVCASIAPGETCRLEGGYTVSQADKDAGEFTNDASATSDQTPLPKKATVTTGLAQNNKPTLSKEMTSYFDKDENGGISVGDTLTFKVTLLNDGDVTLSQVNVKDDRISPSSQSCPRVVPGESCELSGTYKVTQADVDAGSVVNKAAATIKEVPEGRRVTVTTPVPQSPGLALTKEAGDRIDVDNDEGVSVGDQLNYAVTAKNIGNVTLLNVVINDPMITPDTKTCDTLAPEATCVLAGLYTLDQADIDAARVDNVATASADNLGSEVTAEDTRTLEQNTRPTLSKSISQHDDRDGSTTITLGDVLTYTVTLLNDGNTTLTEAVVTDNLISPSSKTCTTLLPGQACELVGSYTVTEADQAAGAIINKAEGTTKEVPGPRQISVETPVATAFADLSLLKNVELLNDKDGSTTLTPGDEVRFTITVTNEVIEIPTGPALGVVVRDKLSSRYAYISDDVAGAYDPASGDWSIGRIELGESVQLNLTALVLSSGDFRNTAEVTESLSQDPDSKPGNDDGDQNEDDESVVLISPVVGLAVEVGTPVPKENGNYTIPFSFVLENIGIVDVCEVVLEDVLTDTFGEGNVVSVTPPVATGTLKANPNYDGITDTNLLVSDCSDPTASRMLAQSDAVVKTVVEVTPTPDVELYIHSARISAKSSDASNPTAQLPIVDISTAGPEPDTNKNNNVEEDEPNRIELKLQAEVDVDLSASVAIANADGSYSTDLTLVVTNSGNLALSNVDLLVDLAQMFPGGAAVSGSITSDNQSTVLSSSYSGDSDTSVFDANEDDGITSNLSVGDSVLVRMPINFLPGEETRFRLDAKVIADSSAGPVDDTTADDVERGEDALTELSIEPVGMIGIAESASPPRQTAGAVNPAERCQASPCATTFSIIVKNVGSTNLDNLMVDQLLGGPDGLPEGTEVVIRAISTSGKVSGAKQTLVDQTLILGVDDPIALLDGTGMLPVGTDGGIELDVEFTLPAGTLIESFEVAAVASALDEAGVAVSDISDNGGEIDGNGNGPSDDKDPTPLSIVSQPIIGVVAKADKAADGSSVKLIDAGDPSQDLEQRQLTYGASFQVEVANLGNTALQSVDVVNSLASTFPTLAASADDRLQVVEGSISVEKVTASDDAPSGFAMKSKASSPLRRKSEVLDAANPNFDGLTDLQLVDPTKINLQIGESIRVRYGLEIKVDYADKGGLQELQRQNFETQIVANGTDPDSGRTISDLSQDVSDVVLEELGFDDVLNRIDVDGDFDPNEPGENNPTPVLFPTAIQGYLCLDANADGICTEADQPLKAWTVRVLQLSGGSAGAEKPAPANRNKALLGADGAAVVALTNENGYYSIPAAPPGSYRFEFVSPQGVLVGQVSATGRSLEVLTVPAFILDPRGMVYDSVTGAPLGGVKISLADIAGNLLPESCLAVPAQQGQVTGSEATPSVLGLLPGGYEFGLNLGAAPECPASVTQYQIVIDTDNLPDDYQPSNLRLPEAAILALQETGCAANGASVDANTATDRCEVSSADVPTVTNGLAPYYLTFSAGEGSVELLNNHIPLDPPLDGLVLLTKASLKESVTIGDLAPYTIRVENLTQYSLQDIQVIDTQAAGFQIAEESLRLRRAGPDGRLETTDDIIVQLGRAGDRPITFDGINLAPTEVVQVSYVLRVGAGVTRGMHRNVAVPELNGQIVGNQAIADIEVVADAIFDLTTLLGKVFADANENGAQDAGEQGLPGVRIATVGGEWIITDEFGRFSLRGIDPGNNVWGRNAILKVDPASLPKGSRFTTENPRVLRITGGLMNQFDFGVKLPEPEMLPVETHEQVTSVKTTINADIEPVRFKSGEFEITESYLAQLRSAIDPLREVENLRLVVTGHTDNEALSQRAKARYGTNYGLANERAKAVAQVLSEGLSLPLSQFVTQGYGPDRPVASNDTAEGMALNRRVEVVITYDETVTETVSSTLGRQAIIEMGESYFDQHRLLAGGLSVLQELASILGQKDLARIELRIPSGEHFVSRKAAIMANLYRISEEPAGAALQKLVITAMSNELVSESAPRSRWMERLALFVLSAMIPPAMAADVVCLSANLCESDDLKIYISDTQPVAQTVMGERGLVFGEEAKVWVTTQPGRSEPRFAIRAPRYLQKGQDGVQQTAQFWLDSTFPDQISQWQLNLYDARDITRQNAIATLSGEWLPIGDPVLWDGQVEGVDLNQLPALAFDFQFEDLTGQTHKVRGGVIELLDDISAQDTLFPLEDQTWYEAIENANHLVDSELTLAGDLVTFNTAGLPVGGTLMIGGHRYPVGADGVVIIHRQMLPGNYQVPVTLLDAAGDNLGQGEIAIEVNGDYFFMVGLADITTGKNDVSGNIELLDDDYHYDGDVYIDGRLAFFLKGRIKGSVLLTAQMDTGEQELKDVFKDLDRNDPRRLFKRIDPDRFYPVYGDNSRVVRDVDTQGKFYIRLDWDRSRFLWGNFNTSFTGTELASFNRSLYGANLDYRSQAKTALGDEKHMLKAFASEPNTRAARDELVGTGGSLYYLRHADVVLGSAKVLVEVRDRKSDRVREQIELVEGQDYEIDPYQGRIMLTRPLRSTANLSVLSIIRQSPLEGDEVLLVVDYEYVSSGMMAGNDLTAGVRGKTWLGDHVGIGVTHVNEDTSGSEFELTGFDLTVKATDNSYLVIETSETEAGQNIEMNRSLDGGLDFDRIALPGLSVGGEAISVTGQWDLMDAGRSLPGQLGFWYRDQEAGFNSLQYHNASGEDLRSYGLEGVVALTDGINVKARVDHEERGETTFDDAGLQLDVAVGERVRLAAEYLAEEDEVAGNKDDSSTLGLRLTVAWSDRFSTFLNAQSVLEQSDNSAMEDMGGVGFNLQASEKLDILGEAFSDGDNSGARVGLAYRYRENSSAYVNYITERSDLARDGLTFGQKTALTDRLRVYNEHRFDRSTRQSVEGDSYGISYDFSEAWTIDADMLAGQSVMNGVTYDRTAYSIGSRYRQPQLEIVNRFEFRVDQNDLPTDRDQWVTTHRVNLRTSDNWVMVAKADYSEATDKGDRSQDARFGEVDFGFAYRPVLANRLNMLAMASYVYDLDPTNQMGGLYADEKGYVLSVEGLYQLTDRLKLGGKYAWKNSAIRMDRGEGPFIEATTTLSILRGRYHLVGALDLLAEYRWLEVDEIGDEKQGMLLGLDFQLGAHIGVGVGYNFTEFNDRLTALDYESKGWFMSVSGRL
ncbi:MAG: OmpA family protein [Proteobacteria bacterium]|nr:OmpA family protein [Pseudomonadota bacterium]